MRGLGSIASPSFQAELVSMGILDAHLETVLRLLLLVMAGCGEVRSLQGRVERPSGGHCLWW